MRINSNERRHLDRRLRNRIPEVIRAGLKTVPKFALVISATIYATPEALAEMEANRAEAHLTLDMEAEGTPSVVEKTYTKDELKKKMPANPVQTLNERILEEMNALLKTMRNNQIKDDNTKRRNGLAAKRASEDADDIERLKESPQFHRRANGDHVLKEFFEDEDFKAKHMMKIANLRQEPEYNNSATGDRLREFFATEAQEAATDRAKSKVGFWSKLTSGLKLDFDFGNLFGGGDDNKKTHEIRPSGKVRYGLVIKEVIPDKNAPMRAAISDDLDELRHAGHADVKWTIGPITDHDHLELSRVRATTSNGSVKEHGFLDSFEMPSTKFSLRGKPEDFDNLSKVDGESSNMPNVLWTLKQEDDYYVLSYKTKGDGTKVEEFHTFKIPVTGTAKFGRRFNDKWEVVQTSLYDILIDKRAPLVSVHYFHFTDQYKATLKYDLDERNRLTMAGQSEAGAPKHFEKEIKKNDETFEKERREQYTVGYEKDL